MGTLFSKRFNPERDLPDLTGKVIIVTGGNAGIGYATIKHLARKGAKVYMGARNMAKADVAIAKLKSEGLGPGYGEVVWLDLDLSDPRNAKIAAKEFMTKENRLDILIHNAACLLESFEMYPDGVQKVVVVNLISPFVLTRELLPVLEKTAAEPGSDVRIVTLASDAHRLIDAETHFHTINDLNREYEDTWRPGLSRYCLSKLTDILYAMELHRRLTSPSSPLFSPERSKIIAFSIHPGLVDTTSYRPEIERIVWLADVIVYLFFVSRDIGAYNSVFCAAAPEVRRERERFEGKYLIPIGKPMTPGPGLWRWLISEGTEKRANNVTDAEKREWEERAKTLWEIVETFLEEKKI